MLRLGSPLLLAGVALLATSSCAEPSMDRTGAPAIAEDGALIVSAPGTILNRYTALAADAVAGATTLELVSSGALDAPAPLGAFGAGDMLLVIQMHGATIDTTDTAAFGSIASLGGAGNYETLVVGAVNGNTVTIDAGCGGLRNTYLAAARTQIVRMPQLSDLTVAVGASIAPLPWNGTVGGIVALHVQGEARIEGAIEVIAVGFRGGVVDLTSAAAAVDSTTYRSPDADDGGEKGESIAGFGAGYDALGGRYGRGAPANGGGGGTAHNGGGGGGANGTNGNTWTGQGVMDPSAIGAMAWQLDPAYAAAGNQLSNSSGGGRGGYTYSANNLDALTVGPGNAGWGGNSRRERGGLGGRPLDSDAATRLFLGGGGGAGDSNNDSGGAGGAGGGLIFIIADQLTGSGSLLADGGPGVPTTPAYNDGPGGGGGGGTIVVEANGIVGPALIANGGNGGSQPIIGNEAEGPGGGGSGGFIAVALGASGRSAAGGGNGTSISDSVTEFPANGSTRGAAGRADGIIAPFSIPACRPVDLSVTKDDGIDRVSRGGVTTWTIVVTNDGDPAGVRDVRVQDPLPASVTSAAWTCTATPGSNCDQSSGTGNVDTTVDLAFQGSATFEITARLADDASDPLTNTVSVSAPPGFADADPANDSATDTDEVFAGYDVEGSGCGCALGARSRRGSAFLLGLLALPCLALFVRGKRRHAKAMIAVAALSLTFGATPAHAGDEVDLQQFKPAPGAFDVLAVESPRVPGHLDWSAIFGVHYANRPMRLVDRESGDVVASVIGHQSAFDVGAAFGYRERFELGIALPVTMNQASGAASNVDPRVSGKLAGSGVGDLRILPKAMLLNRDRWAVGAAVPISLPTASAGGFMGHAGFTARPRLLADVVVPGGVTLGGNAGLALRTPERFVNFRQGAAIELGASALRPFEIRGRQFAAVVTLAGESGIRSAGVEERPVELLAGVRWNARQATVTIGAGPGLSRGAGTPDYRVFMIVGRTPPRTAAALPELPAQVVRIDRMTLKLDVIEPVYFGTANDLIEPRSFQILEQVAAFLRENPWIRKMRIEGHTDNQGDALYNLDLSQLRSISIARFLVQNGVDPDVLEAKGYGLTKPVDTNETVEGRAKNRRVDFVILEIVEATAPDWAKAAMTPIVEPGEPKAETPPEPAAPTPSP